MFIRNNSLKPVGYVPMPSPPRITDDMSDTEASQAFNEWLSQRSVSRRARELFDINDVPWYVPSHLMPSENDTPENNATAVARIHALEIEV